LVAQNSSFEALPVVYHTFNPNRTALIGQIVQLLCRHLSVALTYGGTEDSTQSNGPFAQSFDFASNSSPRILGVNFYYLINESNLPPAPPQAKPTATPTPAPTQPHRFAPIGPIGQSSTALGTCTTMACDESEMGSVGAL
jgi:hypothetical protein